MIFVKEEFTHTENEIEKKEVFTGTLKLKTIYRVQDSLLDAEIKLTIPQIIEKVAELDSSVILTLLTEIIGEGSKQDITTILSFFEFEHALNFVMKVFRKTMPQGKEAKQSMFADEEEYEEDNNVDWDFDYMLYLWKSGLNRTDDMWNMTPKQFFKQLELHEENIQNENKEIVEEV